MRQHLNHPKLLCAWLQVASECTPRGTFYAPHGEHFVTIAYVPLKGEL